MITDYFDKALYINLDERTDRRSEVEAEFAKHSLVVERVSCIKGNPGIKTTLLDGDVGCIFSHLKCVQMAHDNGWKTVLILEDDVRLRDNVNELFDSYYRQVPDDWDMIYLGGNHWGFDLTERYHPQLTMVTENVYRTRNTLTTHAYAIKNTVYEEMLSVFSNFEAAADTMYTDIQKRFNVYAFRPSLAWQATGYSYINNKVCDYSFIRDW